MAERRREQDEEPVGPVAARIEHPRTDPVFTYAEMVGAAASFGVSSETVVGALHAAGVPRDDLLSRKQVEEALKAFEKREVNDA